jgi:hypothetical protein
MTPLPTPNCRVYELHWATLDRSTGHRAKGRGNIVRFFESAVSATGIISPQVTILTLFSRPGMVPTRTVAASEALSCSRYSLLVRFMDESRDVCLEVGGVDGEEYPDGNGPN